MGVAQLVERWLVEPDVAGSSPVVHPSNVMSGPHTSEFDTGGYDTGPFGTGGILNVATASLDPIAVLENETGVDLNAAVDSPWITLVWNDPVNLMSYVSWVFRSYFGFSPAEATRRMMQVHENGRAVVASGSREEMERHVEAMHDFGLWATLEKERQ